MSKRVLDASAAAVLLVFLSPLMLAIALSIALTMGRPVLFRQRRPGLHGAPFTIIKFRTMKDSADELGQSLSDGLRLTRFGQFLRKTSLDELPELWNVLKGDMSLVGPRPLLMEYLPLYTPAQARRHEVLPGMTGWAQVNGRNAVSWEEKFDLDLWYVDNRSLWLDLKILVKTLVAVLKSEGVSKPGYSTTDYFKGSKH